jgi:hypothetical protein
MRKRRACQAVARRLGLNVNRVAALVQRASEGGLLPVATGRARPDLKNMELARLLLAAVADRGLGSAATTTREFAAIESNGLRFDDWLEGVVAGRVRLDGLISVIFQLDPAAVSVLTTSTQLDFGERADVATARVTAIDGDALRAVIEDFNAVG